MSRPFNPTVAAAYLRKIFRECPNLAIVLGSGFQRVLTEVRVARRISYGRIPGFPETRVSGHAGEVIFGELGGASVLILSGRSHFYEGHEMERVTFAVRTLAALGVRDLVLTNAAGGVNPRFKPGDFMLVTDHINFMGANPLCGEAPPGLPRFVDLTEAYDADLRRLLSRAARSVGVRLRTGVYLAVCGPSYETPAEIRAFARLGADAVGMSTVPEVVAARQCGVNVAAISCITNLAAGLSARPLSHSEVLETGERVGQTAARWLRGFAALYNTTRARSAVSRRVKESI